MQQKLKPTSFALAFAFLSAFVMLVLGLFWRLGIYTGAARQMRKWHMFFSPSVPGMLAGMAESALISFVLGYLLAWVYNKFL